MGELTACTGSAVKGFPGSTPGRVGPRPEAKRVRISPDFAGFAAVTRLKSPEWTMAGPVAGLTVSRRHIRAKGGISVGFPPPQNPLFDGSLVCDGPRFVPVGARAHAS